MSNCLDYTKSNIGKTFEFSIVKEITLPGSTDEYYLICDANNCKFLLLKKYYLQYNLKKGQKLWCTLDKINCAGQIYFEPQNPYYRKNAVYTFNIVETKKVKNYFGIDEQIVVVNDNYGQKHTVRNALLTDTNNTKINCVVAFIKKGKLFLVPEASFANLLQLDSICEFNIIDTSFTDRFGKVYIIRDSSGNSHALPCRYYTNYDLESNKSFKGIIQGVSSKGFFYIEPLHPVYSISKTYEFRFFDSILKNIGYSIFVEDCYENIIKIDEYLMYIPDSEFIMCQVTGLKKGKPVLSVHIPD